MTEASNRPGVRLSLCLATMNRGEVIGEVFAGIAGQALEGVELIVVDGSRDDATERVLEAWRSRLPPVQYERSAPRGIDRDYCRAVERSRGDYCWLISDDDPWRPGAIAAVREATAEQPDFVVVNGELRGPDLSEVLTPRLMGLTENRVFRVGEDDAFARLALSYLSYIGAVVVRRSLWLGREAAPYFGTEFVHVGVMLQRPIERSVVVLAEPYVVLRYGVALWRERSFGIWMFNWPQLVWSFPQFSTATKQGVTFAEPWRRFRRLLLMRATGQYDRSSFERYLAGQPMAPWRRMVSRSIAEFPVPILRWLVLRHLARRAADVGWLGWELRNPGPGPGGGRPSRRTRPDATRAQAGRT